MHSFIYLVFSVVEAKGIYFAENMHMLRMAHLRVRGQTIPAAQASKVRARNRKEQTTVLCRKETYPTSEHVISVRAADISNHAFSIQYRSCVNKE